MSPMTRVFCSCSLAVALLSLSACGETVCARLKTTANSCGWPANFSKKACTASLDRCSASDEDRLGELIDCMTSAGHCRDGAFGQNTDEATVLAACAANIEAVDPSCVEAVGISRQ